jgi:hypothetical protein
MPEQTPREGSDYGALNPEAHKKSGHDYGDYPSINPSQEQGEGEVKKRGLRGFDVKVMQASVLPREDLKSWESLGEVESLRGRMFRPGDEPSIDEVLLAIYNPNLSFVYRYPLEGKTETYLNQRVLDPSRERAFERVSEAKIVIAQWVKELKDIKKQESEEAMLDCLLERVYRETSFDVTNNSILSGFVPPVGKIPAVNCEGRERMITTVLENMGYFPDNEILVEFFKDHTRALVRMLDGQIYVLEGNHPTPWEPTEGTIVRSLTDVKKDLLGLTAERGHELRFAQALFHGKKEDENDLFGGTIAYAKKRLGLTKRETVSSSFSQEADVKYSESSIREIVATARTRVLESLFALVPDISILTESKRKRGKKQVEGEGVPEPMTVSSTMKKIKETIGLPAWVTAIAAGSCYVLAGKGIDEEISNTEELHRAYIEQQKKIIAITEETVSDVERIEVDATQPETVEQAIAIMKPHWEQEYSAVDYIVRENIPGEVDRRDEVFLDGETEKHQRTIEIHPHEQETTIEKHLYRYLMLELGDFAQLNRENRPEVSQLDSQLTVDVISDNPLLTRTNIDLSEMREMYIETMGEAFWQKNTKNHETRTLSVFLNHETVFTVDRYGVFLARDLAQLDPYLATELSNDLNEIVSERLYYYYVAADEFYCPGASEESSEKNESYQRARQSIAGFSRTPKG